MAYVPGMPSVGIPTDVREKAEELYEKQQEERKQQEQQTPAVPTIPTIPTIVQPQAPVVQPVVPTSVIAPITTESSVTHITPAVLPFNVAQVQQEANASFINNMTNTALGMDATKVLNQTNVAATVDYVELNKEKAKKTRELIAQTNPENFRYVAPETFSEFLRTRNYTAKDARNALPTDALRAIQSVVYDEDNGYDEKNPYYTRLKEISKLIQAKDAIFQQSKATELADETFWKDGRVQEVSCATSIDYYNMQQRGFQTVYVEDGCGKLENKGTIFSIGRDKLAGLPKDVRTVLIDRDGNWKYLANTSSRANLVEALENNQAASSAIFEKKIVELGAANENANKRYEIFRKRFEDAVAQAETSKKEEDWNKVNEIAQVLQNIDNTITANKEKMPALINDWQRNFQRYSSAIIDQTQWSVEDEAQYQKLVTSLENLRKYQKDAINKYVPKTPYGSSETTYKSSNKYIPDTPYGASGTSEIKYDVNTEVELISEIRKLSQRREKYKDSAAFISADAIESLRKNEAAMKKAVEEYNRWDSVTIHSEKGEDIGSRIKKFMLRDVMGIPELSDAKSSVKQYVSFLLNPIGQAAKSLIEHRDTVIEDFEGIEDPIKKQANMIRVAYQDEQKAKQAILDINEKLKAGEVNKYEAALMRAEYIKAIHNTGDQLKTVALNNIVSDMSVFDLASVQNTFVAWRMAAHPERYKNDPKFKKLLEAYKYTYGEDFRGSMDASKMMYAMLKMKSGALGNDYIDLTGQDLRYESGEKYGMGAAMGVSLFTDLGFLATAAKGVIKLGTKGFGAVAARELTKNTTDAIAQTLVRSGISDDVAKSFAKSKLLQKELSKESKKAIRTLFKDQGDDAVAKTFEGYVKAQHNIATLYAANSIDDIRDLVRASNYKDFMDAIDDTLRRNADFAKQALSIQKGTVAASVAGTVDDAINDLQMAAFKMSCPVAGAVVGIRRAWKGMQIAYNAHLASPENVKRAVETLKNASAQINNMGFDNILDGTMIRQAFDNISDEFSWGALNAAQKRAGTYGKEFDSTIERLAQNKADVVREVATAYTQRVSNDLMEVFHSGGTKALDDFAVARGYNTFDEMHSVVKQNMEIVFEHNPDARPILDNFNNTVQNAVTANKIADINKVVDTSVKHLEDMRSVYNSETPVLSLANAIMHPDFTKGTAASLRDTIHTFMRTAEPDMLHYVDDAGELSSVHIAAQNAMEQLDKYALSSSDDVHATLLFDARNALEEYTDALDEVYIKNLKEWRDGIVHDTYGAQDYLNKIEHIAAAPFMQTSETYNKVFNDLKGYLKNAGVQGSDKDIEALVKTFFVSNNKALQDIPLNEQTTLYRIMQSKAANTVCQINDSNLKILTDGMVDCNSMLSKNLQLLIDFVPPERAQFIVEAFSNSCAITSTRILSEALEAGNVGDELYMAIFDVANSNYGYINSIVRNCSPEVATEKLTNFLVQEAANRISRNNGTYMTLHNVGMDSVDVVSNVRNIANYVKYNKDVIPEDKQYLDVFFSTARTTDAAAPKDLAFFVRGAEDDPFVIRKNYSFSVHDDGFSRRVYGRTSEQLAQDYSALGTLDTVSPDEWKRQLNNELAELKQRALAENKTLRFIGFNSSDAVSGSNKYLSDTLRASGENANTSTALDLADIVRKNNGEFVFDPAHIETLRRGVRSSIDSAHAISTTLHITPSIAYDSKYTCANMLETALKQGISDPTARAEADYILQSVQGVTKGLGTSAYNQSGKVMGMYIDTQKLTQLLEDAGAASDHVNADINRLIANAALDPKAQLGLNKIIESTIDNEWLDVTKAQDIFGRSNFDFATTAHDIVMQLNSIHNSISRIDLITEADRTGLETIWKRLAQRLPKYCNASEIASIARVEQLSVTQLYALDKWLLDEARKVMKPQTFDNMFGSLLIGVKDQASKLYDTGFIFLRDNIVDGTDEVVDMLKVPWLDDSEAGVAFANALKEIKSCNTQAQGLRNFRDTLNTLYGKLNSHGAQDQLLLTQSAAVSKPLLDYYDEMLKIYENAKSANVAALRKEGVIRRIKGANGAIKEEFVGLSEDVIERVSTQRAWDSAKRFVQETGDKLRKDSVLSVMNLNEDAFKAHFVRNCLGGLVIDPHSNCVKGLDFTVMLDRLKSWGFDVDTVTISKGTIQNRELIRISMPELSKMYTDEIFTTYDKAYIKFNNPSTVAYDKGFRHGSFGASDMTLVDAQHNNAFRELFYSDKPDAVLDLEGRFSNWADELYSCNIWADADIKQLVNSYYTDNFINNLAQNTHQMRKNISAVHDLATTMNNRYLNTDYILTLSGVKRVEMPDDIFKYIGDYNRGINAPTKYDAIYKKVATQYGYVNERNIQKLFEDEAIINNRATITQQIRAQGEHVCKMILDDKGRFKLIDYTQKLLSDKTSEDFFMDIIKNTIMVDDGMFNVLADWRKTTNMGLKMQAMAVPEGITNAYNIYKKTIRAATISMYLYGNIGTAMRNVTDSFVKGVNEVNQYDADIATFLKNYATATIDVDKYSNICREIETLYGVVDRETVARYYKEVAGVGTMPLDDFNILYGYERMAGADSLVEKTYKDQVKEAVDYFKGDDVPKGIQDNAEQIRKICDRTYSSLKYRGYTNDQIAKHLTAIHDDFMKDVRTVLWDKLTDEEYETLSKMFYNYHPVQQTWGDKISRVFPLNFNKKQFNDAETRARVGLYKTFLAKGDSEVEALEHVTATQFNYAGIGKVEDFMPFTQYKLYNAAYWFDHANARAMSTLWRFAEANGDGSMTNREISALHAKYRQQQYYIYDQGVDEDYDNFYENYLNPLGSILLDGVDSYIGLPREFQTGSIDLEGTHFLKFGNSFIEETDLVVSCAVGAALFGTTIKDFVNAGEDTADKIRMGYEALKFTPLYDSLYSPWKSYIDLKAYAYDQERLAKFKAERDGTKYTPKRVWDYYDEFLRDKSTHSEAIQGLPVVGAVLSNMVGRWKNFDLNLGQLMCLMTDDDAREEFKSYAADVTGTILGMTMPSLFGTVKPEKEPYNYGATLNKLIANPGKYISMMGRLQRSLGFTFEQAQEIMGAMSEEWKRGGRLSQQAYYDIALDLFGEGFTKEEITNLFKQHKLPTNNSGFFRYLSEALPDYLKYDKEQRAQIIAHYKAMGMSSREAWATLIAHPARIVEGRIVEITSQDVMKYNNIQNILHNAGRDRVVYDDDYWDAYFALLKENGVYYPKGKLKETRDYLRSMGYSYEEAQQLLLKGIMLNDDGKLVDAPGRIRYQQFSRKLNDAEWDAFWNAVPDYTKYEKGAYKRTMSVLRNMGYKDDQARTLIQQGFYVAADGTMLNVTGMQRPRYAGYYTFDEYYQSLPDYIKYTKGAFKETYAVLKSMGFDYETSLRIIQMGFAVPSLGMIGLKDPSTIDGTVLGYASFDEYYQTLPDYIKYTKGAFKETYDYLSGLGFNYETSLKIIQMGFVIPSADMFKDKQQKEFTKNFGKEVLGYADFNTYYNTLPEYIRFEKGAYKRTYDALKNLGFNYETTLKLIQQGAYLMDAASIPNLAAAFSTQATQSFRNNVEVTDVTSLLTKFGKTLIKGADGKDYILINCAGLQLPRRTFSYTNKFNKQFFGRAKKPYQKRSWTPRSFGRRRGGKYPAGPRNYGGHHYSKKTYPYKFKPSTFAAYTTRKPYISQGNVSSFNGFKSMRGSAKLSKPYTTQGYVSTYSAQNFLNGASYGMRKTYKIDMRQFKTGALSTKSAYPASYRNIAVAYRRNMYKDLYAKYGMSRMRMRANKQGYSNAAITRLRRNEIYNRERYAERRDRKAKEKKPTK